MFQTPKLLSRRLAIAAIAAICTPAVYAQDRASKDEATALAAAAIEQFKKAGHEKALADISSNPALWQRKDMVVFVHDMKGKVLAHSANAKLIGREAWEVKDQNGKLFIQEFTATAAKGQGWVSYDWAHPTTKKLETRQAFVRKVPDFEGFVGVSLGN